MEAEYYSLWNSCSQHEFHSGIFFAVEFMMGALVNGLTAAKNFMSDRTVSGVILTVVTLGLLLMAVIAWRVMV